MSPVAPKVKITIEKPKPKRVIGKLAQARRAQKAEEVPEPVDPRPLIIQAIDALPGYAYPTMGPNLKLAGPHFTMSREYNITRPGLIQKMKMADAKKKVVKASPSLAEYFAKTSTVSFTELSAALKPPVPEDE